MTSPSAPPATAVRPVIGLLQRGAELAARTNRDDLRRRMEVAAARINRPDTVIVVIGEFKQGKSSLVNGLLGEDICPVDDDLATSGIAVVRFAEQRKATVTVTVGGEDTTTAIEIEALRAHIAEAADVEEPSHAIADVTLPNGLLARGVTLVDTPGVGGLNPGFLSMTLAYLQVAHSALFVTDASAPLTGPELEFLQRASEICPSIIVALSKIDIFPEWQRVAGIVMDQMSEAGIRAPLVPVSSYLRRAAFERSDQALNTESGYPTLLANLKERVLDPSERLATERGLNDLENVLSFVMPVAQAELEAIRDPSGTQARIDDLNNTREKLEKLRAGGARWSLVMNDGFADLVGDVDHSFRGTIRQINRDVDEEIEQTDPINTWGDLTARVRDRIATASASVVQELEEGTDRIADQILELLQDEAIALQSMSGYAESPEVMGLWSGKDIPRPNLATRAGTTYAGLRGAQGGVLVFGMLASLAGIAISTAALGGIALVFGGKQLFEERKRQVTNRRQQARTTIRQFLDDVQFEVSKTMRDLSRDLQRQVRDHFSERLGELIRTYGEAADSLQRSLKQDEAQRAARATELEQVLRAAQDLQRGIRELRESAA
jgi:Mg2+ and Co2+ transporter CorA